MQALAGLLLVAALLVSSVPHMIAQCFLIEQVQLTGELDRIDPTLFRRTVSESTQGNYFSVDLKAVQEAALSVPWVKSVRVHRRWPDTIEIDVRQHKPLALWEDGRLVNEQGQLFVANPDEVDNPLDLPEFFGPEQRIDEIIGRYHRFTKMLQVARLDARIVELSVSVIGSWDVVIAGENIPPTAITLGVEKQDWTLEDRFGVVIVNYPDVVKSMQGPPSAIDARYKLAFAAALPAQTLQRYKSELSRRKAAEAVVNRHRQ